jgi:glycosyltransferase involved in cell wall biosynthesis
MTSPKVSVCIPVYNGEDYLSETIKSVLNQSFQDFEIVIVDNQSTDKTVNIIQSFNDSRIVFFQNETNIGLIGNWNMVMKKARGKYIKILPADDLIYPDCLKLQVEVFEKDTAKKISLVCGCLIWLSLH